MIQKQYISLLLASIILRIQAFVPCSNCNKLVKSRNHHGPKIMSTRTSISRPRVVTMINDEIPEVNGTVGEANGEDEKASDKISNDMENGSNGEDVTEITNKEKKEDLLANTSSMSSSRTKESIIISTKVNSSKYFDSSPPLSFTKYLTMQEKRVPVVIRYSEVPGMRPYYLTTAKKIKDLNPDVIVEKQTVPTLEEIKDDEAIFEVLVDNKLVVSRPQCKWQGVARSGGSSSSNGGKDDEIKNRVFGMSVFVSMEVVSEAIAKARRKRRPNSSYAQPGSMRGIGLEILKTK